MKVFKDFLQRNSLNDNEYNQEYLKVKQMKYEALLDMMIKFNTMPYESFYQFIDRRMKALELIFTAPRKWGEWHFNDPVKEIRVLPSGLGALKYVDGEINPQKWILENVPYTKVMVRFIILRAYPQKAYGLLTPEKFFGLVHEGVVPYVVRVVAYSKERRYKMDINLVNNEVMADFRWGKIPPRLFKRRSVQEYFIFDKIYASLDINHFPKMVFEAIFESDGMDREVLSLIFNVNYSMIENNVGVLIKHRVVEASEDGSTFRVIL